MLARQPAPDDGSRRGGVRLGGSALSALLLMLLLVLAACADEEAAEADPDSGASESGESDQASDDNDDGDAADDEGSGGEYTYYQEGDLIELHLPFGEGGGTDTLARLLAPFLADELGVDVQVVNQPGGGGVLGTNNYVHREEPDGYTLLMTSSSTQIPPVIGGAGVEYKFSDLRPVAGFPSGIILYSRGDSPFQEPLHLTSPHQPEQVTYAGQPPTGTELRYMLMFEMFGTDVNPVLGHDGSGATRLAWEQGESHVNFDSPTSYFEHVEPLVEDGTAVPLLTLGVFQGREISRDPAWPDLPHVGEVYEEVFDASIEEEGPAWEAYELLAQASVPLNKAMTLHAGAPDEAIQDLETAWRNLAQDEEFTSTIAEELGGYEVLIADDLDAAWSALTELAEADSEGREWLIDWAEENFDVDLREE